MSFSGCVSTTAGKLNWVKEKRGNTGPEGCIMEHQKEDSHSWLLYFTIVTNKPIIFHPSLKLYYMVPFFPYPILFHQQINQPTVHFILILFYFFSNHKIAFFLCCALFSPHYIIFIFPIRYLISMFMLKI